MKMGLFAFTGGIIKVPTKIVHEIYMEEAACRILTSL
jgi:hypothetical protein